MLVGQSKFLKQIIQIKPNRLKNPNWPEANQLAIYKSVIWTQGYCEQIQLEYSLGRTWTWGLKIRSPVL